MPIYEYKCPNGHHFDVFHGMTQPGPEVCEVCGEAPLQRVLHPIAVHYKGSGFYSTDYGKGSKKKGGNEGGSGDSASTSSGSGSSESGGGGGGGSSDGGSSDGGSSGGSSGGDSSSGDSKKKAAES